MKPQATTRRGGRGGEGRGGEGREGEGRGRGREGRGGEGRGEKERGGEGRERSDECLYRTNFKQWCVSTSLATTVHKYLHTYVSTSVVPIHTYTLTYQ